MKSYSTRVQEQKRRRADAAGSLGSRKLPDVRQIVGVECPDLWPLQGEQRHSVAIIADEFHFKGYSLAVHEHSGPDVASQQLQAYPDIKPKVLPVPPPEAVQKAIDAARSLGWQIAGSDTAAGRIEATDTTGWFGFKDDIVIRVRPQAQGSRIDVRSASRVGRSDVGKNAERIRDFLDKLG